MNKILVIEDESNIHRLIKLVLEKNNFAVEVAECGEDALKKLSTGYVPDLILLDIMMPGMDGLQVLKEIQLSETTAKTPVILLTALAQENVVLQGIKLGAKDYIRKPFHPKDLMERVSKFMA